MHRSKNRCKNSFSKACFADNCNFKKDRGEKLYCEVTRFAKSVTVESLVSITELAGIVDFGKSKTL